jgi:hypothetical protein
VYALVASTLRRFERALGRSDAWGIRVNARGSHQIKVVPHAFMDANAIYSREQEALLFGYFPDQAGRIICTCLSHDIVVRASSWRQTRACSARLRTPMNTTAARCLKTSRRLRPNSPRRRSTKSPRHAHQCKPNPPQGDFDRPRAAAKISRA